jgi:hypothetical protein
MPNEPAHEDLALHRRLTLLFMTLALAVPIAVCTVSMCLLLALPVVEGVVVALVLAGLVMFLGSRDDALQEEWLEGTREDWERERQTEPPRPKDGYYGW